jgi:leucyl-tRNA synthetase
MKKPSKIQYEPLSIEPKWQSKWKNEGIYHSDLDSANPSAGSGQVSSAGHSTLRDEFSSSDSKSSPRRRFYNLMMFPYPSAEGLHIGGVRTFSGVDIYGRFKRMQGSDVFEPFGLDGFGIHAENYALKIGENPMTHAGVTEKNFYRQIREAALAVDWDKTVETYKPDYYKWTQWLFTELFRAGLAYRKKSPVNFCPSCKTVLADEQVVQKSIKSTTGTTSTTGKEEVSVGVCERCETPVEKKNLEQWFFRITKYADRLLANIDSLDWTEKVKIAQRNWIGRSEGARIEFKVQNSKFKVEVFTTAIDTIYGVTFMVISPEHPLVEAILNRKIEEGDLGQVQKYVDEAKNKSEQERLSEGKEKTGVSTGLMAINPFNGKEVPIWIADYVLMGYGTGAVMGVPGHDARDHEFALKFNLPIKPVVKPKEGVKGVKVGQDGFWDYPEIKTKFADKSELFDSGEFNGLTSAEAKAKMLDYIEKEGFGERKTTYHLRDWLISRQRYWGPPIPMIHCEKCAQEGSGENEDMPGWYSVSEKDLPVELPFIEDFKPLGTSLRQGFEGQAVKSPLGNHPEFYNTKCPHCGGEARRETDVSDTFLDSAWYFLRYLATDWDDAPFPSEKFIKDQISIHSAGSGHESKNKEEIENWKLKIGNSAQRAAWLPVTMYIGGAEHSVLHLLYARFITMFLKDQGYISFEEPFARFYAHGLIIKEGAKMSKSKGNVVGPDIYVKKYGTDTLRMYLHFLAPFNQDGDFRDSGIEGMHRFLRRVWALFSEANKQKAISNPFGKLRTRKQEADESLRMMHETIKKVTEEMEALRFNTAIAQMMTWYNFLSKQKSISSEEAGVYLRLLAPFAPHMAEDLFQQIFKDQRSKIKDQKFVSIHQQNWPEYDKKYLVVETVTIPVQVNGKLRGTLDVSSSEASNQAKVEELAKNDPNVSKSLQGKTVRKAIYIQGKVLNFVV